MEAYRDYILLYIAVVVSIKPILKPLALLLFAEAYEKVLRPIAESERKVKKALEDIGKR